MKFDPASRIQDLLQFGEFGDVNPSITDSATYTFMHAKTMLDTFHGEQEGCFLYSRHWNPSNKYLSDALAAMEGTESAWVTASGMGAITCAILQICNTGDHIVSSETTYGGTFAFMNNYLKKFNIEVSFVDITNLDAVKKAIKPNTKMIYTETMTNPLLQISDIPSLAEIANKNGIKLVVDNTFTPMIVAPATLGAHIVVYSMTKFINGKNDCVAGAICANNQFINDLISVNDGTAMLLGPVLDPLRSSSIHKNLHTLHIRMKQHSANAMYLAQKFKEQGVPFVYPGVKEHPQHELFKKIMNPEFGFGGLIAIDLGTAERASRFMEKMQLAGVGYLAVSLGYFKTLFSNSGKSTSSEVPDDIQKKMGLSEGLVRFSVGLDNDMERSFQKIKQCYLEL
ncbi:MAG: aminotransferase class I/II-fold pyridoxal phosphate-dependent enzyme [Bacteroidales bacterium]|mgnify:CR=1 FL=1|nr:aminotransferase class I/II-fold pyridoxal phosphate-dependent enzyme [Bacteroidales bacterium]